MQHCRVEMVDIPETLPGELHAGWNEQFRPVKSQVRTYAA
jgi:hypothetical protein